MARSTSDNKLSKQRTRQHHENMDADTSNRQKKQAKRNGFKQTKSHTIDVEKFSFSKKPTLVKEVDKVRTSKDGRATRKAFGR